MRAGLATIQQTLTAEAAAVLNRAIAESARRRHGQTTPLHVAATLLAAPAGLLRQACARSHPLSSHPLQCRALELCFSVALDRLPTSSGTDPVPDPPLSNALMAALKRAQAHQRRGCPDQQQAPLLAVKVELEQLVVSILDDPSVSRVMREAGFSSPAVKAAIEQSLVSPSPVANSLSSSAATASGLGLSPGPRALSRNLYISPRLQQQQPHRMEEVKKVLEILTRTKKRNPVLVGDNDPDAVKKEVLSMIERRELGSHALPAFQLAQVVNLEREFSTSDRSMISSKIRELGGLVEPRIRASAINGGGGVILDLGDLKWLVEGHGGYGESVSSGPIQLPQRQVVSEMGREVVAEMGRLLKRFGDGGGNGGGRVWVVGTATCATYLRCQVYFPSMEVDWDLQAVPIAPRSRLPGLLPRHGGNGILSSSVESLSPLKSFPAMPAGNIPPSRLSERTNASQQISLCHLCTENYERELAKLVASEFEKSSSESRPEGRQALSNWLQIGTPSSTKPTSHQPQTKEQELRWKQRTEELLNKWQMTCIRLHPNSQQLVATSEKPLAPALLANAPGMLPHQTFQTRLTLKSSNHGLQLNTSSELPTSPPGSPVKTDLILGQSKALSNSLEKTHGERAKDFPGCMQDRFSDQPRNRTACIISDTDSLKRLFKGLIDNIEWQPEAASAVATTVMQCRSGNGKRRGLGSKANTWLLFIGPDKVGKRKMAYTLSELVFGAGPVTIRLGSRRTDGDDGESNVNLRGKTSMDRVAEAVQQNPFCVFVLDDIDDADTQVLGTIKKAIERGRLPDSNGREVSLGGAIFVLLSNWLPDDLKSSQNFLLQCKEKILDSVNSGWQLEFSTGEKTGKRRADWLSKDDRTTKAKKGSDGLGLSLDLNLAVGIDDDACEGSRNSSDLTVEHEQEESERLAVKRSTPSYAAELIEWVDNAIMFKPVDFGPLRRRISESISTKFAAIMGSEQSIQVDEDALDQMVGGATAAGFEEWAERVLAPSIRQLKNSWRIGATVRLSSAKTGAQTQSGDAAQNLLPSSVVVNVDGV